MFLMESLLIGQVSYTVKYVVNTIMIENDAVCNHFVTKHMVDIVKREILVLFYTNKIVFHPGPA
ncbi:hypothetical protein EDD68_10551 [Melghiribacillus thermohalophilus]|uniref:Uncharacterized protein n=1 Tax=Melghiribacillus thermohalophilus TaxID=1324956 RepID=A0A4R3NBY2_9BACI|nr:hypothetical protein EDD68_10551 [Melghiribacillus thermohalophilus]